MSRRRLILSMSVVAFASCSKQRENATKINKDGANSSITTAVESISRLNLHKTIAAISLKSELGSLTPEQINRLYLRSLAYDTALEYGDGNIDTSMQWNKLKILKQQSKLNDQFMKDPLSFNNFFNENPNDKLLLSNLSEKVIGNKQAYESYVKWFNQKLKEVST